MDVTSTNTREEVANVLQIYTGKGLNKHNENEHDEKRMIDDRGTMANYEGTMSKYEETKSGVL